MSTKRPSIVVLSEIIQKYQGSDFDDIAFIAQRLTALEASIAALGNAPQLAVQADQIQAYIDAETFVPQPLLDYAVDFSGDGYSESTLGALLSAFAIDLQLTEKTDRGTLVVADNATQTTPVNYVGGGVANLPNDGLAPLTDISQAPEGITTFYNTGTNQFDFSQFAVGDIVTLRVDLDIATSAADQEIDLLVSLAEGSPSAKTLKISREYFRTAGAYNVVAEATFYITNTDVQNNPGHVQINSADDASIVVNTFEAFVNIKN